MQDNHIHAGQWFDHYYAPQDVFDAVFAAGVEGFLWSSTTSCVDQARYTAIEQEIGAALRDAGSLARHAAPLLWFAPDYARQGVSVEQAFGALPYRGIKLHPRAHRWDLTDPHIRELAHRLFDYAHVHELPVLIHTGDDDFERPDTFSAFFAEYPRAKVILAHGRPVNAAIDMLRLTS